MQVGSRSLLDYLDAPVIVGDPDGRVVYLNEGFTSRFGISAEAARGGPLAHLFGGGAREAVLRAVADVCAGGRSTRFRLREGGSGYLAMASPISSEDDRVGVVILLTDEPVGEERAVAWAREVREPLEELTRCLAELSEVVGGRRSTGYRTALESGVEAVTTLRKQIDELLALLESGH